jgi:hypothetical protein
MRRRIHSYEEEDRETGGFGLVLEFNFTSHLQDFPILGPLCIVRLAEFVEFVLIPLSSSIDIYPPPPMTCILLLICHLSSLVEFVLIPLSPSVGAQNRRLVL